MAGRDRLHRLVWVNDIDSIRDHLASEEGRADLNRLDVRGNTPLVCLSPRSTAGQGAKRKARCGETRGTGAGNRAGSEASPTRQVPDNTRVRSPLSACAETCRERTKNGETCAGKGCRRAAPRCPPYSGACLRARRASCGCLDLALIPSP